MAKLKQAPNFLSQLRTALISGLKAVGIDAKIRSEPVATTKLYRVAVFAPQFKSMSHSERQGLVWRIVEKAIQPEDQLRISMILTLTDAESTGK